MGKWLAVSMIVLCGGLTAQADSFPHIVQKTRTPRLHSANISIDAATGELQGLVYLNRGYETPRLPHVHVYGFGPSRRILFSGCAEVSDRFLHLQPRSNLNPRDTFSIRLPANYSKFTEIEVVTDSEDRCENHSESK